MEKSKDSMRAYNKKRTSISMHIVNQAHEFLIKYAAAKGYASTNDYLLTLILNDLKKNGYNISREQLTRTKEVIPPGLFDLK